MVPVDSLKTQLADSLGGASQSLPTISLGWTLVKMVFWLAVVIALILLAWILFKRVTGIRSFERKSSGMRVLDRIFIGQNKSIVLVKIFDKVIAFYEASNTSEKLGEWSGENVPEEFLEETHENPESFYHLIRKLSRKN